MDKKYEENMPLYNPRGGCCKDEDTAKPVLTIKELVRRSHALANEKGFWSEEPNFPEKLALIHSEISEILEEYRAKRDYNDIYHTDSGSPKGIPTEIADVVIRIADLCGYYNIDLEAALELKHNFNKTRPYKHGKKI